MSRRHTLAVNERDKKWSTPRKKNGLTGRVGAKWRALGYIGAKKGPNDSKNGYRATGGPEGAEKLDTEAERGEDGTARERTEAGGSETEAKMDTSTAR